jgi:hypothetical protein
MAMTTYTIYLPWDRLRMRADMGASESPIQVAVSDDEGVDSWESTQYQVGQSGHQLRRAAVLAVLAMGPDYWLDPSQPADDLPGDEIVDGLIQRVVAG